MGTRRVCRTLLLAWYNAPPTVGPTIRPSPKNVSSEACITKKTKKSHPDPGPTTGRHHQHQRVLGRVIELIEWFCRFYKCGGHVVRKLHRDDRETGRQERRVSHRFHNAYDERQYDERIMAVHFVQKSETAKQQRVTRTASSLRTVFPFFSDYDCNRTTETTSSSPTKKNKSNSPTRDVRRTRSF